MSDFAAGVKRWATAMQTLAGTPPGSPEFQQALLSLQSDLASQLDTWLRTSHPLTGLRFGPTMPPFASAGSGATAHNADTARMAGLLNQWLHLQGQLAAQWVTVGRAAAERFGKQLITLTLSGPTTDLRKLYDLWIDCAEAAYAETAHSEGFGRCVADLINTAVALQLEGRQHLQQWARAAGLPTREEIDTLRQRIEQLEQRRRPPAKPRTSRQKKVEPSFRQPARSRRKRQS